MVAKNEKGPSNRPHPLHPSVEKGHLEALCGLELCSVAWASAEPEGSAAPFLDVRKPRQRQGE